MTPNLTCPDCKHPARSHGLKLGCTFPECECRHTYFAAATLALEAENVALRRENEIHKGVREKQGAEIDRLRADLDSHKDASVSALDEIAKLCGCPECPTGVPQVRAAITEAGPVALRQI
jgi:hypothetical protein